MHKVTSKVLKNALKLDTWLDTNLMYWWFDVIKDRYANVIFYNHSVCVSLKIANFTMFKLTISSCGLSPNVWIFVFYHQSWWRENKIKALKENIWGKDRIEAWEAKEKRLLVFIIWHEAHFTLFVGNTQERRWDFYNSIKTDRSSLPACKEFISSSTNY